MVRAHKFGKQFSVVAEATNTDELTTPFQAPKAKMRRWS
jgi:hypothetical protein